MKRLVACILIGAAAIVAGCGAGNSDPEAARRYIEQKAAETYPGTPDSQDIPALRDRGKGVFRAAGCEMCHSATAQRNGLAGPPLGGISERMLARHNQDGLEGRRWLFKHIRDPQRFPGPYADSDEYRGAFMPPNGTLKDDDLRALIEFLWHLP